MWSTALQSLPDTMFYSYTMFGNDKDRENLLFRDLKITRSAVEYIGHAASVASSFFWMVFYEKKKQKK